MDGLRVVKEKVAVLGACSRCQAGGCPWDRIADQVICPDCQESLAQGEGEPLILRTEKHRCAVCQQQGTVRYLTYPLHASEPVEMDLCPRHFQSLLGRRLDRHGYHQLSRQLQSLGFTARTGLSASRSLLRRAGPVSATRSRSVKSVGPRARTGGQARYGTRPGPSAERRHPHSPFAARPISRLAERPANAAPRRLGRAIVPLRRQAASVVLAGDGPPVSSLLLCHHLSPARAVACTAALGQCRGIHRESEPLTVASDRPTRCPARWTLLPFADAARHDRRFQAGPADRLQPGLRRQP